MSRISEYLRKKYEHYPNGIPTVCLDHETLAGHTDIYTLKRRTAKSLGCINCPQFIPIELFIATIEHYLQEITKE